MLSFTLMSIAISIIHAIPSPAADIRRHSILQPNLRSPFFFFFFAVFRCFFHDRFFITFSLIFRLCHIDCFLSFAAITPAAMPFAAAFVAMLPVR